MPNQTIQIVASDPGTRWGLGRRLDRAGYRVLEAATVTEALEQLRAQPELILIDSELPGTDGLCSLRALRAATSDAFFIMLLHDPSAERVLEATKEGAYCCLGKPLSPGHVLIIVRDALESCKLRREVMTLAPRDGVDRIIARSPRMLATKEKLRKVARSGSSTILVTGESGTGKDLAAKAIHVESARAAAPFMNITCSALPETLLDNELFGHEAGAFTDARERKKGLLEQANGGTVFLDEVGEMSPGLQAKLLRFLEDRAFKRVGGAAELHSDVRIIAATHRDLRAAAHSGGFREDLFYRLAVVPIEMPALRERAGDIELLSAYFVKSLNQELGAAVLALSRESLTLLESHPWPGNVRELRNALERAMLLSSHAVLPPQAFEGLLEPVRESGFFRLPPDGIDFEALERDLVEQALERAGGNQTRAASLLGMNRDQVRYRIGKFRIPPPRPRRRG